MKIFPRFFALVAALALVAIAVPAEAQIVSRVNDDQVKDVLGRMEANADRFRSSLDGALDESGFDGSRREDRINRFVKEFEQATDSLSSKFDDDNAAVPLVREVLERAARIDRFMTRHSLSPRAQADWSAIRTNLDELARAYNVQWTWAGTVVVDRATDKDVKMLLARIETNADSFKKSLDHALDRSPYNGTNAEDEINDYVGAFEDATDRWRGSFDDDDSAVDEATEVLRRAARIEAFLMTHRLTPEAHASWMTLRSTLDELARAYNVAWTWEVR